MIGGILLSNTIIGADVIAENKGKERFRGQAKLIRE